MKYKIAIWEEISGYIDVEAESKEEAEQIAVELMDDYGCNKIFNGVDLRQYNGDFSHRKAEIIHTDEIKDEKV
jgi:hypothetical protein